MSQDNLFQSLLAEAESKRHEQEAHAEAVKAAKRAELQEMVKGVDKALKGQKKGFKPVPSLRPQRGIQLAACKRNHQLIEEMVTRGESYAATAKVIEQREGYRIDQVTVNNYCKTNDIQQGEKDTWENQLRPQLEAIKKDIANGATRAELSIKYGAPMSSIGDFLKRHGLSTKQAPKFKLDLGSLKKRDWS